MISKRAQAVDTSGIRRVFELAASIENPINLSIGQPDFDAAAEVREATKQAIDEGKSGYTLTQGIAPLRDKLRLHHGLSEDTDVFVTAGTSAGILLAYLTLLDPGDKVLIPDPFFCMYRDVAYMVNAEPVYYDTYPDFRTTAERIERALVPGVKALVLNSPNNPTGYAFAQQELDEVLELAASRNLPVIYDEIYDGFCYDGPHANALKGPGTVIVLNGFSKTGGVPGWRAGYVIGPKAITAQMTKLQQYTFVCTNSAAQWGLLEAVGSDFSERLARYKRKRDLVNEALAEKYEFVKPGGAFYAFPAAPGGSGQRFIERCLEKKLLLVPGHVFSQKDTHFRLSFSAPDEVLMRGLEVLRSLA